ncbi:divergent polysaccharide deacetylase family protein [Octadecabacter sp. G9-8]|uniref:Divergent polysaccharide deacetylase family protein n=1 Tax=Octadecabacter dasysiphoniae TaxID=2909341 RepID=A0ABS9D0T8_9RHOB|nr:polysaccharide deacteylase family 2 protein [Octadecabacter dasysiphoniae]MCF2872816.1 divergent polysaccharide deacetylase family protein [Octadecabacter dasysiphoniae]
MRGLIGGMLTGGLVSVLGLGVVSVVSEQPAGVTPPEAPLVQAPMVDPVETVEDVADSGPSTPVGSLSIQEPQAPALPMGEAVEAEPTAPVAVTADAQAPRADTDPLDEPEVTSVEGAMEAPPAPQSANVVSEPVAPVLPNPQALAPQTPENEADLTVSTTPAQPTIVIVPDTEVSVVDDEPQVGEQTTPEPTDDFFVVDLGADASIDTNADPIGEAVAQDTVQDEAPAIDAPADPPEDLALNTADIAAAVVPSTEPRLQLGGANTLLTERDTGVTIRRPGTDEASDDVAQPAANALQNYAADADDFGSKPLMSVVLIDDGSMSAAAAALAGLPFPVSIALDPALPNAADLMASYRADGFEVVVMAKVPEGALPSDVEVTFESVFSNLPETIAVLDIGAGGLQADRAVTEQAMDILAYQGRGFITASQGLNMAGRAAQQAGVPSAVVFRDLDIDNQDARVVRRFVDQAAFRARQESGVVLIGRVRPDTISALILWGTANQEDQIAVVPVSAVLLAE